MRPAKLSQRWAKGLIIVWQKLLLHGHIWVWLRCLCCMLIQTPVQQPTHKVLVSVSQMSERHPHLLSAASQTRLFQCNQQAPVIHPARATAVAGATWDQAHEHLCCKELYKIQNLTCTVACFTCLPHHMHSTKGMCDLTCHRLGSEYWMVVHEHAHAL